jgi:hypothetical protein
MVGLFKILLVFAAFFVYAKNSSRSVGDMNVNEPEIIQRPHHVPANKKIGPLQFRKQMVAAESFESVGVFDVNNDSRLDIVSGAFWYEAPTFLRRHYIGQPKRFGEYYDDFSTIPFDVDGDGWIDFITGGWADTAIYWRKNPGNNKDPWKNITIGKTGNVETTRAWDIDGDGTPEIVSNNPGKPVVIFKLITNDQGKGTGKFQAFEIWSRQGHGLGFGDINNDGRGDLLLDNGWLEAPVKPFTQKWIFHPEFSTEAASIPMIVKDINSDGKKDFIAGKAHHYGLNWYEQKDSAGKRVWKKHVIDPLHSQYHTMELADLDNDSIPELITGKRYRAHNDQDPGSNDPIGLYYYQWNGESFTKQVISYGRFGEGKGTGIYFQVIDLQNDGKKDIVVAGKDGLCIFYNEGYGSN